MLRRRCHDFVTPLPCRLHGHTLFLPPRLRFAASYAAAFGAVCRLPFSPPLSIYRHAGFDAATTFRARPMMLLPLRYAADADMAMLICLPCFT